MKKTEPLLNINENRKTIEEECHIYSFNITKKLLEKYKPNQGIVPIEGRKEKSGYKRAA